MTYPFTSPVPQSDESLRWIYFPQILLGLLSTAPENAGIACYLVPSGLFTEIRRMGHLRCFRLSESLDGLQGPLVLAIQSGDVLSPLLKCALHFIDRSARALGCLLGFLEMPIQTRCLFDYRGIGRGVVRCEILGHTGAIDT